MEASNNIDFEWFKALACVPAWKTFCGKGWGLAASARLGIVATTNGCTNTISLFQLPRHGSTSGLRLISVLGKDNIKPFKFQFKCPGNVYGGGVAFATDNVLFVTDPGHASVHMIDAVHQTHLGLLDTAGALEGVMGVDAKMDLVAISCWGAQAGVRIYRRAECKWVRGPVISITEGKPIGLRLFQENCTMKAMMILDDEIDNDIIRTYSISDRKFADKGVFCTRFLDKTFLPVDVDVHRGLLMALSFESASIACFDYRNQKYLGCIDDRSTSFEGFAVVPGFGVLVRDVGGHIQVFATPDDLAIETMMSVVRVAWMASVFRAAKY